jgi:lipopolysaccharide transport system ATP-binding protein
MPIIEVDHVTKEYELGQLQSLKVKFQHGLARLRGQTVEKPKPFKALDDVSFSIEPGEVVGILGHNGAGKSTLLKLLSRIVVPTRGRVTVRGRVAPLIEVGAGLVGDMTGRENIYLNGAILGMSGAEIRRLFDEIVAFAELEEFIDTPLKRYSSGMQVRLGFAVAITATTEILIVDEVLSVGDVAFQRKCLDRMEKIIVGGGHTVLVVGHDIRTLERICSRMLLFNRGRVLIDSDPASVCKVYFEEAERKIVAQAPPSAGGMKPSHDAGIARLVSIELIGASAGNAGPEVPMNGSVRIRATIHANRAIQRCEIVIGAHTPDMVNVFSMSSALHSGRPDLPEGVSEVECAIPDMPLRPGQYSLRMVILDQMHNILWQSENLHPFRVIPGEADITRIPVVGLTHLKCTWKIGGQLPAVQKLISSGAGGSRPSRGAE